jgi:predicted metalloendopeptidase
MNRFTKEQLTEKAEKMQTFLEIEPSDDLNEMVERIHHLGILISQSGKMLADAKYYKDTLVNDAIMQALKQSYEERLSASTINKYVETAAKESSYLVNWIDRINSTATHQLDGIRSVLSYRKAEFSTLNYNPR